MVSHTTRLICYAIPRCPGPSHPDTKYVAGYRALPCTPGGCYTALRPLTGAVNTNEGRVSSFAKIDEGLRLGVA
eukprot:scaffold37146_cov67-Phaeocystis_antarctica.AAC.4